MVCGSMWQDSQRHTHLNRLWLIYMCPGTSRNPNFIIFVKKHHLILTAFFIYIGNMDFPCVISHVKYKLYSILCSSRTFCLSKTAKKKKKENQHQNQNQNKTKKPPTSNEIRNLYLLRWKIKLLNYQICFCLVAILDWFHGNHRDTRHENTFYLDNIG